MEVSTEDKQFASHAYSIMMSAIDFIHSDTKRCKSFLKKYASMEKPDKEIVESFKNDLQTAFAFVQEIQAAISEGSDNE